MCVCLRPGFIYVVSMTVVLCDLINHKIYRLTCKVKVKIGSKSYKSFECPLYFFGWAISQLRT